MVTGRITVSKPTSLSLVACLLDLRVSLLLFVLSFMLAAADTRGTRTMSHSDLLVSSSVQMQPPPLRTTSLPSSMSSCSSSSSSQPPAVRTTSFARRSESAGYRTSSQPDPALLQTSSASSDPPASLPRWVERPANSTSLSSSPPPAHEQPVEADPPDLPLCRGGLSGQRTRPPYRRHRPRLTSSPSKRRRKRSD